MTPPPPRPTLFPYTTLFRSHGERYVYQTPLADRACCSLEHFTPHIGALALDGRRPAIRQARSEEHTSELQSRPHLVCRLLLEKKNTPNASTSAIVLAHSMCS